MKFSLGTKITLAFVAFAIVLSGITLAIGYRVVDDMNSHHYMRKADEIAATVSRVVDTDAAAKLKADVLDVYRSIDSKDRVSSDDWGSPAFEEYSQRFAHLQDTPEYQKLLGELRKLQEVNDVSCFYLWYVDPQDEVCIYLVDAALEDPCPIGCIDPLYDFNRGVLTNPATGFPAYITDTQEYGWLVTAATPVFNEAGDVVCYAATDISMDAIKQQQRDYFTALASLLLGFTVVTSVIVIFCVRRFIVRPINTLSEAAARYCSPEESDRSTFENLEIHTHDEIGDLHQSMIRMEHDIDSYIERLMSTRAKLRSTQIEAYKMSDLARHDALTGVRNKLAYDQELVRLGYEIDAGVQSFGIAVIDLNDLKKINDLYGHDCGNVSLKKLCNIICHVFAHSPVFRIGGDEFVVVLRGHDFGCADELVEKFRTRIEQTSNNETDDLQPWECISAAIGYAAYDAEVDENADAVFKRADELMYQNKRTMKAGQEPR